MPSIPYSRLALSFCRQGQPSLRFQLLLPPLHLSLVFPLIDGFAPSLLVSSQSNAQ
jgi:hypothetical protein